MGVVVLPFSAWRKFKLETRFGFNRITPRLFVLDTLKTLIVTLILGIPLAASVLWIMGNTGPNWVWWAWGTWVLFNFLILGCFRLSSPRCSINSRRWPIPKWPSAYTCWQSAAAFRWVASSAWHAPSVRPLDTPIQSDT